ncbi:MAG: hypothetical protein IPG38_18005 [Chitinophagaceae bacterium]|nr:hypothetical protein [Chitinophagaceae bacterium]
MRKLCFILLWVCFSSTARSQTIIIDSFKRELAKAGTNENNVELPGNLSRILMNTSLPEVKK